ncbi:MAG: hypothetical protein HQ513_13615 [Rhodospirillales bacterium]|nr:hypothetical protein [Rhodospirillales bacterium]
MIPLAVAVIAFTVSNRSLVHLELWPSPYSLEVPIFAAVLVAVVAGFLSGAIVSFLAAGSRRARNRQLVRMLENSKREEAYLREQIKKLEAHSPAAGTQAVTVPLLTNKDAA